MTEIDDLLTDSDTVAAAVAPIVLGGGPRFLFEADYLLIEATYPAKCRTLYLLLCDYYNRVVNMYRHLSGLAGTVAIAALDHSETYSIKKGVTAIQTSCTAMEADYSGFTGLLDSEVGHSADHLAAVGTKFTELLYAANAVAVRLKTAINAI